MALAVRRRTLVRVALLAAAAVLLRLLLASSSPAASAVSPFYAADPQEIQKQGVLDLVTRGEKALDARKHTFLQVRMGRDERPDVFKESVEDGAMDFWERFQKP